MLYWRLKKEETAIARTGELTKISRVTPLSHPSPDFVVKTHGKIRIGVFNTSGNGISSPLVLTKGTKLQAPLRRGVSGYGVWGAGVREKEGLTQGQCGLREVKLSGDRKV